MARITTDVDFESIYCLVLNLKHLNREETKRKDLMVFRFFFFVNDANVVPYKFVSNLYGF